MCRIENPSARRNGGPAVAPHRYNLHNLVRMATPTQFRNIAIVHKHLDTAHPTEPNQVATQRDPGRADRSTMSAALAASVPYTGMPPSATAASSGFGEALNRAFAELHKAVEHNDSDRRPLLEYVENDARDLNGKPLMIFINDVYIKIESKIRSDSVVDRLVGIRAIDELMDSKVLGETAAKVSHFAKFLKEIFQNQTDRTTLEAAARVEGHVVKSGGPLAADVVDNEVRMCVLAFCSTWQQCMHMYMHTHVQHPHPHVLTTARLNERSSPLPKNDSSRGAMLRWWCCR